VIKTAVRVEQIGAVTAQQVRDWLVGSMVRVQPVIDLAGGPVVDGYELTGRLREQVMVRDGFDVFPFGEMAARGCDLDPHATPFRIAGRTDPGEVNPLSRTAHRAKTHGGWRRVNTAPGRTEWTSPVGQRYCVDHGRTTDLGPVGQATDLRTPG
jgi:hypothetical protein